MTAWTGFSKYVRPFVPGCPEEVITTAVKTAGIEFCKETSLYRANLSDFSTVVGTDEYTLNPPANTRILYPVDVTYDQSPLMMKTEDELDDVDRGWRIAGNGTPLYYFMLDPTTIKFSRKSDEAVTVKIRVALYPTEDSTSVDDLVFEDFYNVIAEGAKAILFNMKGYDWYEPNQARACALSFQNGKIEGYSKAYKGNVRKTTTVRMKRFI